jgi:molybdate transport system ATP-binding protein
VQIEARDDVTVFFGPSGSGKTVTLDCIAGFIHPDEGRILIDDALLFDARAKVCLPPQARQCGYVFQKYALFPHMSLRENLAFAAGGKRKRVSEMLERFRLQDVAGRYPRELSGGQKQRGSIARALLAAPKVLLLDEPAQGLDAVLRMELYSVLREVRESFGTPVLLVTHDWEEALELGDRMLVFSDGRVVQTGKPAEVLDHPASPEIARILGVYNVMTAEIVALDPVRKTSRIRIEGSDVPGPYFPGHFIGDRLTIGIHPSAVGVSAARHASDQITLKLDYAVEGPHRTKLVFEGGLRAELEPADWAPLSRSKDFAIVFAPEAVRLLKG